MTEKLAVDKTNLQKEYKIVLWICVITPILAIIFVPFLREYSYYLIYLQLPGGTNYLGKLLNIKSLLMVVVLSMFPLIWLGCIKLELRYGKGLYTKVPVAVGISVLFVVLASMVFNTERIQWFFLEAGKARYEQTSLEHALISWKQKERGFIQKKKKKQVLILGSSQINAGIDRKLLVEIKPDMQVRVRALPGFGILQYHMLSDYILKQKTDIVVCWISEFDTFREQRIPANRLRYFAETKQVLQLVKLMGIKKSWYNRGQMADISFASYMALWRDRDIAKKLILNFWWPYLPFNQEEEEAKWKAIAQHAKALGKNIQQTVLVETNFDSFELFAKAVVKKGIKLYVVEGTNNPVTMSTYDPGSTFRRETRNRLQSMAGRIGFCYIDESQLPTFDASDFADAVHLNVEGRKRFTCFLADYFSDKL